MIGYEFSNLSQVFATFRRYEQGLESMIPLWEACGKEFYAQETKHFAEYPFAPLSPAYATKKQEQFGSKPILRAMDDLFKSFTQQGAAGNIHDIRPLGAVFGSSDFKARLHQTGTSKMPVRPPLAEPNLGRYQTIAGVYLMEIVNKVI